MCCKELGINHFVKAIMGTEKGTTEEEMQEADRFIRENKERIQKMLSVLADDDSRQIWKVVMECRKQGKLIPEKYYSDRDQYFVKDIVHLRKNEVFVDCGAFIGDTLQHLCNFAKRQGASVSKMVAFEPDPENLDLLRRNFGGDKRVCIIPKGVSDREGILRFSPNGSAGTFFDSSTGDESVDGEDFIELPVTALDLQVECSEATFIKMDIEGSELAALRGAQGIIRRNHPRLAICIYHSLEDMVGIIEYVHEKFPEYNIYVRHHTKGKMETVMYAVMPESN